MQIIIVALAAILLLFVLTGCGDDTVKSTGGKYKQTVQIAYSAEPNTFDPHTTGATAARELGSGIYEGLFDLDANYQPKPVLCEKFVSNPAHTEYTFYLRKGVTFHNGQEMKADDVCASLNRWIARSGITSKSIKKGEQFEKVDDYTVKIQLKQPVVLLPYILANYSKFAAIMPKSVVEEAGKGNVKQYVGTGPLKFVEWNKNQYVHLEKYDGYQPCSQETSGSWGNKPVMYKDIYINFVTDPATRLAGVETGQYDMAAQLAPDDYLRAKENPNIQVKLENSNTLNLIMNKKEGLLKNEKIREAMGYAVDVNEIMAGTLPDKELYNANAGYFSKLQKDWYTDTPTSVHRDQEKAKSILQEAGYDGTPVRIITVQSNPVFYNSSLILQQELESAGFKTQLLVYDWATMLDKLTDPSTYDCYTMNYPLASNPASVMYITSNNNAGFTNDAGLNEMFDTLNAMSSVKEASAYWKSTMQKYANDKALAFSFADCANIYALGKNTECNLFYNICFWSIKVHE